MENGYSYNLTPMATDLFHMFYGQEIYNLLTIPAIHMASGDIY